MLKKTKLFILSVLLISFATLNAQVTTSSINGKVASGGESVIGAAVVAVHQPSGTTYNAFTNTEGRFNLNGMRTGGPYTVAVTYIGLQKVEISNIQLQLGETYPLNVEMNESSEELNEIIVSAQRTKFTTEKTGATTSISNDDMQKMPTINRSITDIARISPYASGMSFAGGDGRSTNFTVDGANFNNNFGLSSNLPGGGNPISLDAIEEVQVVVAPFDVRQTNFIGGGINAITKSGNNKLKGSVYTFFTNQDLRGNRIDDTYLGEPAKSSKNIYGFNLGGPIVKNKLFFFVNGEMEKKPGQVVYWRPSENGVSDGKTTSRVSMADMEKVKKHLMDKYGYDAGSYTDYPGDESNVKFLGRLDWNINNSNKLSFRYNYTKNTAWNPTNGNSSDTGLRTPNTMSRISQYGMAFSNSIYSMDNIVNGFSLDLNSRINDKISNQFLATYTTIKDMRGSNSTPFPFIDILVGRDAVGVPIVEPYISAGYELFTWNNGVNNNKFSITDNVNYYLNNHKFTAGANFEYQMANNSYMRNGTGYYRYASIEDFLNQAAPIDFALDYGYNGELNPTAQVAFNQIGLYAQDEWNLTPAFKLTYGVRADYIAYMDNLIRNNAVYDLDFGGKKIDTGSWPTPKVQLSPRVGFNWDVFNDNTLKLRGGTGIFTGRLPLVFFTNMPTQSGMVKGIYKANTTYKNGKIDKVDPNLALLAGPMITNVNDMISKLNLQNTITPEDGAVPSEIAGIDPDFKMPQVWKTSFAIDYQIPVSFPFTVTVEGIYTKKINDVMLKNYDLMQPDDTWSRFSGADDRLIYPANYKYNRRNAFVLSNNSEGWGAIGNIMLNAEPVNDLNLMLSYTYTESREITGMPGSNAGSAYGGLYAIDGPHLPTLQRSQYVTPHKVIGSVSYRIPWTNNVLFSNTTLNLFYTGYSYSGYTYYYSGDMNGDGYQTDLMYIPTGKGDIKFTNAADEEAFFKFMEQDKYLTANKGKYAGANAVLAPWLHNFDFRIAREIILKSGNNKNALELSLDFLNVGNLLNNKWGIYKDMASSNNGRILKYDGRDANNVPSYSMPKIKDASGANVYPTETFSTNFNFNQTWKLQIGLRYKFN